MLRRASHQPTPMHRMGVADDGISAAVSKTTRSCSKQFEGEEYMAKKPASVARKNGKVTSPKRYSAPARTMNKPTVKTPANTVKTSAVRNTPIPKTNPVLTPGAPKRQITPELIAERAYYISISGTGGSQEENWHRAERELREGF